MGDYAFLPGEVVRLEFSSSDATTAAAISAYTPDGTARTLGSDERLYIDVLNVRCVAAVVSFTLFDDANAGATVNNGERLFAAVVDTVAQVGCDFSHSGGMPCGKGRLPKVKAAVAGAIELTGVGRIRSDL